ncbi:SDR family oxidoreductase [Streptomyces sp. NPDC050704]|uniref:SDR family oxidoreductase n=1 Tax=Streptomyces sp. NPDC050704 TaxID=3157219 RepID=UPI0034300F62
MPYTPGRAAVVTGSSRGIGRAVALRLAADGFGVVVNYRTDAQAASDVVRAAEAAGGRATAVRADAADPAQLRTLFDAAHRHYGGVDAFVHNAGGYVGGTLAEATDEDYERAFAVNARAAFTAFRAAARDVREHGRVIYISSAATRVSPAGQALYAAAKAAGEQLVRTFAREVGARGITANSVLPGPTNTRTFATSSAPVDQLVARTPLGRIGEPEDIANVVAFLASDDARWVTGQSITVDGGLS